MMTRRVIACGLAALVLAAPAGAGSIVVRLGAAAGRLSVKAAPATVSAGGIASVHVTVRDGRGNGNGWMLRLKSGPAVTVTAITATCASDSTCTLPVAAGTPSGATVLRAMRGTGLGVIDLTVTVRAAADGVVAFTIR
jgi:hypothetical protein